MADRMATDEEIAFLVKKGFKLEIDERWTSKGVQSLVTRIKFEVARAEAAEKQIKEMEVKIVTLQYADVFAQAKATLIR